MVDIPKGKWEVITAEDLENATPTIQRDDIVIIHTGWHRYWGDTIGSILRTPPDFRERLVNGWLQKALNRLAWTNKRLIIH